jgi:hypothetical protein
VTAMQLLPRHARNQDGIALLFVLLLAAALAALALAAVSLSGNARLITLHEERQDEMEAAADAGLETVRARVNANRTLFPDSGYVTVENNVPVTDAAGTVVPGLRRYTYAGPIGVSTGQYGVFGAIVSEVRFGNGDRLVRRADVVQESFAKFAYFTNIEPADIAFGSGDVITGPVHSNDEIKIYPSRATFRGPGSVTTARYIEGKGYGTFVEGYEEGVGRIELPQTTELVRLRAQAAAGGTAFTEPTGGGADEPRIRIEFLTADLDQDGNLDPDEGFFRVYVSRQGMWMMAYQPGAGWQGTPNCGFRNAAGQFISAQEMPGGTPTAKRPFMRQANAFCYLGGDPRLNDGLPDGAFLAEDATGAANQGWVRRPFAIPGALPPGLATRADRDFLFPLSRSYNANFKGVIHVTGDVAVSGVVHGRLTIAATETIFIPDDLRYAIEPGVVACEGADMVGLFSGEDVVVADNMINTPMDVGGTGGFRTYDDTSSEFIHGVILALNIFTVRNFNAGPDDAERCEGTARGRGCLFLSGGVIQSTRGAVGTTTGTGYLKRYSYDSCARSNPPPYFPTTGRFSRSRYFEVDPAGFDVRAYYDRWAAGR